MYEQPKVTTIGEAQEVIRGFCGVGYDFDTLLMIVDHEFQSDLEGDSGTAD